VFRCWIYDLGKIFEKVTFTKFFVTLLTLLCVNTLEASLSDTSELHGSKISYSFSYFRNDFVSSKSYLGFYKGGSLTYEQYKKLKQNSALKFIISVNDFSFSISHGRCLTNINYLTNDFSSIGTIDLIRFSHLEVGLGYTYSKKKFNENCRLKTSVSGNYSKRFNGEESILVSNPNSSTWHSINDAITYNASGISVEHRICLVLWKHFTLNFDIGLNRYFDDSTINMLDYSETDSRKLLPTNTMVRFQHGFGFLF